MKSIRMPVLCAFVLMSATDAATAQSPAPTRHFKDRLITACIGDPEPPAGASDLQRTAHYSAINVHMMGFDSPDDPLAEVMVRMALQNGPEKDPIGYCLAKEREAYLAERRGDASAPAPSDPGTSEFDAKVRQEHDAWERANAQAKAEAEARREAEDAEAWAEFVDTTSAMLGAQARLQGSRVDPPDAATAAHSAVAAPAPSSPPPSQGAVPMAAAPARTIHRPELDAGACVRLVPLASGDPLSSYGSQVFSNQCGQAVEVFWCKVGDECERGAGGTWTVQAGGSWPVSSGQYRFGACFGANSGALVRDASGVHTGRYACTGP